MGLLRQFHGLQKECWPNRICRRFSPLTGIHGIVTVSAMANAPSTSMEKSTFQSPDGNSWDCYSELPRYHAFRRQSRIRRLTEGFSPLTGIHGIVTLSFYHFCPNLNSFFAWVLRFSPNYLPFHAIFSRIEHLKWPRKQGRCSILSPRRLPSLASAHDLPATACRGNKRNIEYLEKLSNHARCSILYHNGRLCLAHDFRAAAGFGLLQAIFTQEINAQVIFTRPDHSPDALFHTQKRWLVQYTFKYRILHWRPKIQATGRVVFYAGDRG